MKWNIKTVLGIFLICSSIIEFFNVLNDKKTPIVVVLLPAAIVITAGIVLIRLGRK